MLVNSYHWNFSSMINWQNIWIWGSKIITGIVVSEWFLPTFIIFFSISIITPIGTLLEFLLLLCTAEQFFFLTIFGIRIRTSTHRSALKEIYTFIQFSHIKFNKRRFVELLFMFNLFSLVSLEVVLRILRSFWKQILSLFRFFSHKKIHAINLWIWEYIGLLLRFMLEWNVYPNSM